MALRINIVEAVETKDTPQERRIGFEVWLQSYPSISLKILIVPKSHGINLTLFVEHHNIHAKIARVSFLISHWNFINFCMNLHQISKPFIPGSL
jgi:hypothetical protein